MVVTVQRPTLSFVVLFFVFSLLFLSDSFKLWFHTEQYYADMQESLKKMPGLFRNVFSRRLKKRETWLARQKIFSVIGAAAVLFADLLILTAYMG